MKESTHVTTRQQRRSLGRATAATRAAGDSPAAADELDKLRAIRTGSYALMQVLVEKLGGGPIEISRAEWKALPPTRRLKLKVDPDSDDVRLEVITVKAGTPPD